MSFTGAYITNSIEGNILILYEINVVLEGITIDGILLREYLEVIIHRAEIRYVEEIIFFHRVVDRARSIKSIHHIKMFLCLFIAGMGEILKKVLKALSILNIRKDVIECKLYESFELSD